MSKPTSRAKSTTRAKPTAAKTARRNAPTPIRREVGAAVCCLLAIFCLLGLFGADGSLLTFLTAMLGHFIGWGTYTMPIFLLIAAYILLFHRGRPVQARVWCAMLLPLWLGSILQLWFAQRPTWGWDVFSVLWKTGGELAGGGVISGLLSLIFATLLGNVGATVLFLMGLFLLVVILFRIDLVGIIDAIRNHEAPAYEEQPPAPKQSKSPAPPRKRKEFDLRVLDNAYNEQRTDEDVASPQVPLSAPPSAREPQPALEPDEPIYEPELTNESTDYDPMDYEPIGEAIPVTTLPHDFQKEDDDLEPFGALELPPGFVSFDEDRQPAAANTVIPEIPVLKRPIPPPRPVILPAMVEHQSVYRFPPISLLNSNTVNSTGDVSGETRSTTGRLSDVIHSFKIDATAVNVVRGPSVARYEFELAQGISLTKLTNRAKDIALNLGVDGVRISPVSGKANIVGIEVPNRLVNTVFLRDVMDNAEFRSAPSKLTFALGQDISGANILADISKLTHLLVAGTTGSGKSVCINSLIVSLLYKASPDEVKVILIDPKMVELGIYNGIPHLLVPVVTDPKKASSALQWAVVEMERRYRMLQEQGVRDFFSYNQAVQDMPELPKMAQIVIIIDELADLMMVAGKEVEESIIRIAQKARAAGMHLVLATQRPSANVITGLMKSNIPSRIAFAVASGIDSRIILDETGAEELIGRGDMLFAPLGAKISRVQGCLITGQEVEAVVSYIKQNFSASYSDEVMDQIERGTAAQKQEDTSSGNPEETWDTLLYQAMDTILEVGQASTSMLQRRLKLGYARAARLIDQLEQRGLLGPSEGSKPRQILVSWEQWQSIKIAEE